MRPSMEMKMSVHAGSGFLLLFLFKFRFQCFPFRTCVYVCLSVYVCRRVLLCVTNGKFQEAEMAIASDGKRQQKDND